MPYALLRCCVTPIKLAQYEAATDAVLERLGIEQIEIREFNCCGYPLKNVDFAAYLLCSARDLALAERRGLHIMTVCNCCYQSLKYAAKTLGADAELSRQINGKLQGEGLLYRGEADSFHLLEVLLAEVGLERLAAMISRRFSGPRIAVHYGCRLLRPRQVVQFDNPFSPSRFDQLVEVTGAVSVHWSRKLECCGSPQLGVDDDLSLDLTTAKIKGAMAAGADFICVACPYCQFQLDTIQERLWRAGRLERQVPAILYPQLLGLSLGIDPERLGLGQNRLPPLRILDFLH